MVRLMPAKATARFMMLGSPMTRGRQRWRVCGRERAMAMISGPMPAGSPMLMPMMGGDSFHNVRRFGW